MTNLLTYCNLDLLPSLLLLLSALSEQADQDLRLCHQHQWLQCHETASVEMKGARDREQKEPATRSQRSLVSQAQ